MTRASVVVAGSANIDFTARVSRLPEPGETVLAVDLTRVPGGKGLNQAVAAARQGVPTAFIGCVGTDSFGDEIVARLVEEDHLDLSLLDRSDELATGMALIAVDRAGDNTIVVASNANHSLTPERVQSQLGLIDGARVLLVQLEVRLDAVHAALEFARRRGIFTVLDPAPAAPLPEDLLALVDLLTPNESELAALTGVSDDVVKASRVLLARGCRAVVTTLGARGARYDDGKRVIDVPSVPVKAVDGTAAGDAFCGALAATLSGRAPLDTALTRASAAGAHAASKPGAMPALPNAPEVDALLAKSLS